MSSNGFPRFLSTGTVPNGTGETMAIFDFSAPTEIDKYVVAHDDASGLFQIHDAIFSKHDMWRRHEWMSHVVEKFGLVADTLSQWVPFASMAYANPSDLVEFQIHETAPPTIDGSAHAIMTEWLFGKVISYERILDLSPDKSDRAIADERPMFSDWVGNADHRRFLATFHNERFRLLAMVGQDPRSGIWNPLGPLENDLADDSTQREELADLALNRVTRKDIASAVHLEPSGFTKYTKNWPSPIYNKSGRRAALWNFQSIIPALREQFGDDYVIPEIFEPGMKFERRSHS